MFNDAGLMSIALESEIAYNNLEIELMREEAFLILKEEDEATNTKGKFISKLKAIVEFIKKLWNSFSSKIIDVMNKMTNASSVARNYVIKYETEIKNFKEKGVSLPVSMMVSEPETLAKLHEYVNSVTVSAHRIVAMEVDSEEELKQYQNIVNEANKTLKDTAVFVHTGEKKALELSSEVGLRAIKFLRSEYPASVNKVKQIKREASPLVQKANRDFRRFMNETEGLKDNSRIEKEKLAFSQMMVGRHYMSLLVRVCSSYVSILNQTYVDYYAICRKMGTKSMKAEKKQSKESK
jgi:hypothetical protein